MAKTKQNKSKLVLPVVTTKFDTMIPNYSFWSITFRIVFSFLVAFVTIQFVGNSIETEAPLRPVNAFDYIRTALRFFILPEILLALDTVLEHFLPFPKYIRKRILVQLVLSILVIIIIFYFTTLTLEEEKAVPKYIVYFGFGIGFTFVILFSSGLLVTHLTQKWVLSQKQIEEMEEEKIKMDYDALQEQLNPNFMFNNLSVLKSLIMFDKDTAIKFADNFTDVYRYALHSRKENLVEFSRELEFIESYIALHKERLGEKIQVRFELDKKEMGKKIVPRTLQLLVENVIRHNVAEQESPLLIKIEAKNGELIVENKIKLKDSNYSSQQSLDKLQNHYKFMTQRQILIFKDENTFKVTVPLL